MSKKRRVTGKNKIKPPRLHLMQYNKKHRNNYYTRPVQTNYRTGGYAHMQPFGLELKYWDEAKLPSTISSVSAVSNLYLTSLVSKVKPGSGESQRIGNKIRVKKIQLKGYLHLPKSIVTSVNFINPLSATPFYDRIKIWVVLDTQCNGAAPNVEQVIQKVTNGLFMDAPRNLQYSSRYQVLSTCSIACSGRQVNQAADGVVAVMGNMSTPFEKFLNVDIPIVYKAATGAIGDLTENNIFIMAVTERGESQLALTVRVRYED